MGQEILPRAATVIDFAAARTRAGVRLRLTSEQEDLLLRAASYEGVSVEEFILSAVEQRAKRVIADA